MNMLLFLIITKSFYWVNPDGLICAVFDKPVREHSGYVCIENDLKDPEKYKWDSKEERFIFKPPMKIEIIKDSIEITADSPIKTKVIITEKTNGEEIVNSSFVPRKQTIEVMANSKTTVSTKQLYVIDKIIVINELCYPMFSIIVGDK